MNIPSYSVGLQNWPRGMLGPGRTGAGPVPAEVYAEVLRPGRVRTGDARRLA